MPRDSYLSRKLTAAEQFTRAVNRKNLGPMKVAEWKPYKGIPLSDDITRRMNEYRAIPSYFDKETR